MYFHLAALKVLKKLVSLVNENDTIIRVSKETSSNYAN